MLLLPGLLLSKSVLFKPLFWPSFPPSLIILLVIWLLLLLSSSLGINPFPSFIIGLFFIFLLFVYIIVPPFWLVLLFNGWLLIYGSWIIWSWSSLILGFSFSSKISCIISLNMPFKFSFPLKIAYMKKPTNISNKNNVIKNPRLLHKDWLTSEEHFIAFKFGLVNFFLNFSSTGL